MVPAITADGYRLSLRYKKPRNDVTYHTEEYVGCSGEGFSGCGCHGDVHQPGQFSDDVLHHSQVEQHRHHGAEEYNNRQHLQRRDNVKVRPS